MTLIDRMKAAGYTPREIDVLSLVPAARRWLEDNEDKTVYDAARAAGAGDDVHVLTLGDLIKRGPSAEAFGFAFALGASRS